MVRSKTIPDLLILNDLFRGDNQSARGSGQLEVLNVNTIYLGIAIYVTAVHMYHGCIGIGSGNKAYWLSRPGVLNYLGRTVFQGICPQEHAGRDD